MKTHLTIVGDRQHGKTEALLRLAFSDASFGDTVLFQSENAPQRSDAFARASGIANSRKDVIKVVLTNGNQRIVFESGGRILFGVSSRGVDVDTHIIDSPTAPEHPGAQRIIRSALR